MEDITHEDSLSQGKLEKGADDSFHRLTPIRYQRIQQR